MAAPRPPVKTGPSATCDVGIGLAGPRQRADDLPATHDRAHGDLRTDRLVGRPQARRVGDAHDVPLADRTGVHHDTRPGGTNGATACPLEVDAAMAGQPVRSRRVERR